MKKYRIPIFMAMICMISNVAVFGQETEKEEKEKVLKVWAESYGDCQKRMEYMSDDMKKTYFADQFQRANENTFLLLQSGKTENVELHEALEVVNFRLENGDTIFYTLKNKNGKEYYQVEYVAMEEQNNHFKVESSRITNAYDWKDWKKEKTELPENNIYAKFSGKEKAYTPIVTVAKAEKIDRQLLPLFLDHIQSVFEEGHSSYYVMEMLNIDIQNVKMKDDVATIDFTLQEVLRRYPRNPDTVGYIQKTKEKDKEEYTQLYRQYYTPFYGNYNLRFSGNKTNPDSFRIYTGEMNEKGKIIYNWSIEQQFPAMDANGAKWYLGTINSTKDDYGRTLFTIIRKQWNLDTRGGTDKGYFVTSYGKQMTYPLAKDTVVTCWNQDKMEVVNTKSFENAAGKANFGASRLFWFRIENNYIVEIKELV